MPWAERVRLPLLLALIVLVADQLVKWWMLEGLALRSDPRVIEILPFFNLVMVWNTGVSFGLLGGGPEVMRWLLTGLAIAISAGLAVWIARSPSAFLRFCLAAVIGGAIGNAIDRIRFGAVADFFDLHAFGWHWPAFNIADAAIVIGVLLLLAEPLIAPRPMGEKEGDDPARKDMTAP